MADINKNANGDINKNAGGDINKRNAGGDINRNAENDELGRPETQEEKPLISEVDNLKEDAETTVEEVATVIEVEGDSLKDKFLSKTNTMGVTEDGKISKSFGWGVVFALGAFFLYNYANKKGYLKKLPFYK